MRRTAAVLLVVGLVALAGCSTGPGTGTEMPNDSTDDPGSGTGTTDGTAAGTGTVNFWVSDRPGALDDFEHLNVTVTRVGFERAGGANGSANDSTGGWVERDINETTVDLTRLAGENATLADSVEVPNGTYTKTFMYASEVEGTTTDGEQPNVKLPSRKLQLESEFTVGANETVDFVFDIKVTKAGKSGKYVIRPVISESGTDKSIRDVDADDRSTGDERTGESDEGDGDGGNSGQGDGK